ncbi:prenyltransferase, UbiA family protein [Thozetella sp. PMI_491]|nr:prenyltransferase, UbiA family protein [Thozetella sp. PMI_491]
MAQTRSKARAKSSDESAEATTLAQQYGGKHTGEWVGWMPASWVPYIQLARLSPPAAIIFIYFPHLFGGLLGATIQQLSWSETGYALFLLFCGSVFFSNAAHAWNDLIDADVDRLVPRTRTRPIARGAITKRDAFLFTLSQAAGCLAVLYFFPPGSAWYTLPNIVGTTYYPFAKRHTNFAQIVLGLCVSWGIVMGSVATGYEPFAWGPFALNGAMNFGNEFFVDGAVLSLYLGCTLWITIHDTIYAHQDAKHDAKLGLKSLAVLCGEQTKPAMWLLLCCMQTLLATCGRVARMGTPYYLIMNGGTFMALAAMLANVKLHVSASCWQWFQRGWMVGFSITAGLLSEFLLRKL